MTSPSPEKLAINGIKLSMELVQIGLLPGAAVSASRLFHDLAGCKINIPLILLDLVEDRLAGACCIAAEDLFRAAPVIEAAEASIEVIPKVGALTVFPHRARLDLLACMLSGFARRELPIYAVASSFATLTFTTDYARLDEAVDCLLERATLPENHAPFRPEFKVRQV
jgi:hypothetical protein